MSVLAALLVISSAPACELLLLEPRTERELQRLRFPNSAEPALTLSFVHSVLGTTVQDHYRWRAGLWVLVQESFVGEGYGLPHAAQAGERLTREANGQWTLHTQRVVAPLVVRPVSQMQLGLAGRSPIRLDTLTTPTVGTTAGAMAIELRAVGCAKTQS